MIWILVVVGVLVILGLALVVSYNRFVAQRQLVRNAWANIDTELRRRYDLIPNLVETVKGYASHEREVFEEVTRARSAAMAATGSPEQQAAAEGPLVEALRRLFAVVENYPDLKASQNFLALQGELSNTEDRIQASRRFYNANVQEYNRRIHAFPSTLIAGMFGFHEEQFFEIEEALRPTVEQAPRVDFGAAAPARPALPPLPLRPPPRPPRRSPFPSPRPPQPPRRRPAGRPSRPRPTRHRPSPGPDRRGRPSFLPPSMRATRLRAGSGRPAPVEEETRMKTVRSSRWRHGRLAAALVAGLLVMPACTAKLDTTKLEEQIAQGIQEQTGATGVTVDCPDDIEAKAGDEFECQATSDDGTNATVKVTQNDDQGNVTWAVE